MPAREILTPAQAAQRVPSGARVMVGGFGLVGAPLHTLEALAATGTRDLTIISNNLGEPGLGLGKLLRQGQVRHAIGSFFTSNPDVVAAAANGTITVEVMPQGTFVEAIRAGGAGLGGFFTPTGVATPLTEHAETRDIDGVTHVFARSLRADVALIKAHRADRLGNLIYARTGRNFNPLMATAAKLVIAEVDEIVETGALDPEAIITPHLYVDAIVEAPAQAEALGSSATVATAGRMSAEVERIVRRARHELLPGDVVNLGIGMPTFLADLLGREDGISLHTENGLLGVGPAPDHGSALDYPVNAGKQVVTALAGASYFDSAASFAMIRGGHVDVALLGALQVDATRALASWAAPGKPLLGAGGAMDLARGAARVVVLMSHCAKDGAPKLVERCTLPLTAPACVDTIITELGVFRFHGERLVLEEIAPGVTAGDIVARTGAPFVVSETLRPMLA
jgi:3-oxoacid CoA-transferase